MSEILLTIIILSLISFIIYNEREHNKEIKNLVFLIKSQVPADYDAWRATETPPKPPEEEQFTEISTEELTPEQVKNMCGV